MAQSTRDKVRVWYARDDQETNLGKYCNTYNLKYKFTDE